MNNTIISLLLLVFVLSSCEKEGIYTQPSLEETNHLNSDLLKSGTFTPTHGITVAGNAEILRQNSDTYVRLVNFAITSGPDLKVYLSKRDFPSDFVNLGALENSRSSYQIPSGVDIDDFPFVLIHCQQYNHLFAVALLK